MTTTARSEIVVGLNRSPSGRAAWNWASAYSRSHGDRLRAVHVYEHRSSLDRARNELQAMFAESGPEPDWQLDFLDGHVGEVLLEQSQHARMLVIGTREHVGINRVVDGSVSHFCLNNAHCPVVAVPPGHQPAEETLR